jgi:glycosyltransferase involved in cell wall biosynthesis
MKKVLIITYYWPPSGGAGVQRWLKFAKYLPQYGWEPVVLTVDTDYAAYPVIDTSLEKDVPESVKVYRTKATDWFRLYRSDKSKIPSGGFATNKDNSLRGKVSRFIRGNFFIPDPRRGWNRFAIRKAIEIINNEGINNIITTSPPHSTQLIGLRLKKLFPHLKWIADLRDPWTGIYYYKLFYPTIISKAIDKSLEKAVLNKADVITTVSPSLGKHFEFRAPGINDKIKIISNGYDESDFENIPASNPGRFTISYTGTISEAYPIDGFIKGVREVIESGNEITISFTGHIPEFQKNKFNSLPGKDIINFLPYSDHATVVRQMLSSSVQLLILPKVPDNKCFLQGKLFEYIASGKPILCLGPVDGDTAEILKQGSFGACLDYDDSEGIASFISKSIAEEYRGGKTPPGQFSRRALSGNIAQLLS